MTSGSADPPSEKDIQEVDLYCSASLSLAVQFLLKRLTCQSVVDPWSRAEGDEPRSLPLRQSTASILGTAPWDKGQVGWSTINHSLFLLSAGTREVTSSPNTSRHTRWLLIFFFLYRIHLSLPPKHLLCLLLWLVCCAGPNSEASHSLKSSLVSMLNARILYFWLEKNGTSHSPQMIESAALERVSMLSANFNDSLKCSLKKNRSMIYCHSFTTLSLRAFL